MKNIDFLKRSLIAHRGVHNSIIHENTLPAFVKSVDKNYIIELDIHILKDNKCVITEKECEFLKEEGVTTKLNLDYCD